MGVLGHRPRPEPVYQQAQAQRLRAARQQPAHRHGHRPERADDGTLQQRQHIHHHQQQQPASADSGDGAVAERVGSLGRERHSQHVHCVEGGTHGEAVQEPVRMMDTGER